MAASVHQDRQGPDWPLGLVVVATPGTPVGVMSVVDAANSNAPQTATPPNPGSLIPSPPKVGTDPSDEFTVRAQQIIFQGVKAGASHGLTNNSGNIYIVRQPTGANTGNRDDTGVIVATIAPGQTFILGSAALNRNVYNPYRYRIDADNANDAALVTLIIQ